LPGRFRLAGCFLGLRQLGRLGGALGGLSRLRRQNAGEAVDQLAHAPLVLLEGADFFPLGADLVGDLRVQLLALLALFLQFGVTFLLFSFDFRQFLVAGLGILGQRLFAVQGGVDFAHQFGTGQGDGGKIMQVTRHLVGVIAIKQQLHRIRRAAQVLLVEQLFQLALLLAERGAQFLRLLFQVFERFLQSTALLAQIMDIPLQVRYLALGIA